MATIKTPTTEEEKRQLIKSPTTTIVSGDGTSIGKTEDSSAPSTQSIDSTGLSEGSPTEPFVKEAESTSTPYQTERERGESLIEGQLQETDELGERLFDESGLFETTLEGQANKLVEDQANQRNQQAHVQTQQRKLAQLQFEGTKRQLAGAEAASRSKLEGREGPQSDGNVLAHQAFTEELDRRLQQAQASRNLQALEMGQARDALTAAQRTGKKNLIQQAQSALNQAELEVRRIDTQYFNALSQQQQLKLDLGAENRANFNTFTNLANTGAELNTEGLINMAKQLNLPFETVNSYYQSVQSVRDDKNLSQQEKEIELASMADNLDAQLRGVSSEEARRVDDYMKLVQSGQYSEEELSSFAVAMNIPNENNPVYQADLKVQAAELKIKEAQANGELINPIDQLNYTKAVYELNELKGNQPGSVPNSGVYEVSQTENGIRVNVQDGVKYDNPNTLRDEGQCGAFVNDVTGTKMGNTFKSKMDFVDKSIIVPEAGMFFVMTQGFYYDENGNRVHSGHTGMVEEVNAETGMMTIVDANWDGKGTIRRTEIPIDSVEGFGRPPNGTPFEGAAPEAKVFSEGQKVIMDQMKTDTLSKADLEVLESFDISAGDYADYLSTNFLTLAPKKREEMQTVLESLIELKTMAGKDEAVGFHPIRKNIPFLRNDETGFVDGTPASDFAAKFNSFKNQLALPLLENLKGAISDKDILFIQSAATSLSLAQSVEAFDAEILKLEEKYQEILDKGSAKDTVTDVQEADDDSLYESSSNLQADLDAEWDSY